MTKPKADKERYRGIDGPEAVACCLSCTRYDCPGDCERVGRKSAPHYRPWTRGDTDRLLALHAQGLMDQEIADIIGANYGTVAWYRRKLGLPANGRRK